MFNGCCTVRDEFDSAGLPLAMNRLNEPCSVLERCRTHFVLEHLNEVGRIRYADLGPDPLHRLRRRFEQPARLPHALRRYIFLQRAARFLMEQLR